MVIFIREDFIVKQQLYQNLRRVVNKGFYKRDFADNFTEEELAEIIELEKFLKEVSLYHESSFTDERQKFLCITFKASYIRKNGIVIEAFFNRFIKHSEFQYDKIEHFIAKCIYRLSKKRCIDTYFAVNTFRLGNQSYDELESRKLVIRRRRDFLLSSSSLFCDIDLDDDMIALNNESVLKALKKAYPEVFAEMPPSYIVRSGGGLHLYFVLEESFPLSKEEYLSQYLEVLSSVQKTFSLMGSDRRCVDTVRILRVPYSVNRKPKYGKDGRSVDIIYQSGNRYSFDEVKNKFSFFEYGGSEGIFRQILEEMIPDSERYQYAVGDLLLEMEDAPLETPLDEPLENPEQQIEEKPVREEMTDKEHRQMVDVMIKRHRYKGIQQTYDYSTYPAVHYLEKDILLWLQNRNYHEGLRNRIIYFFYYINYVMLWERNKDTLYEKIGLLNRYFKPRVSDSEIQATCDYFFRLFEEGHGKRKLRNKTIDNNLFFTDEEKEITIANYTSMTMYERCYKKTAQKNAIKKQERYAAIDRIFEENPNITLDEFMTQTGYGNKTYYRAQGRIADKLFEENPSMTRKEFIRQTGFNYSAYYRAKDRYKKRHS